LNFRGPTSKRREGKGEKGRQGKEGSKRERKGRGEEKWKGKRRGKETRPPIDISGYAIAISGKKDFNE